MQIQEVASECFFDFLSLQVVEPLFLRLKLDYQWN